MLFWSGFRWNIFDLYSSHFSQFEAHLYFIEFTDFDWDFHYDFLVIWQILKDFLDFVLVLIDLLCVYILNFANRSRIIIWGRLS